jgi:hypothetical protein
MRANVALSPWRWLRLHWYSASIPGASTNYRDVRGGMPVIGTGLAVARLRARITFLGIFKFDAIPPRKIVRGEVSAPSNLRQDVAMSNGIRPIIQAFSGIAPFCALQRILGSATGQYAYKRKKSPGGDFLTIF